MTSNFFAAFTISLISAFSVQQFNFYFSYQRVKKEVTFVISIPIMLEDATVCDGK